jgi:hypothetical protein
VAAGSLHAAVAAVAMVTEVGVNCFGKTEKSPQKAQFAKPVAEVGAHCARFGDRL